MALQKSVALRNAQLDSWETVIGPDPVIKIFTGSQPANVAAADSGTKLAEMTLPTDWMAAASGGTKAKSGTWEDPAADASGDAGYWRLYEDDGTTCHAQGSVTASGGGGQMELQQANVAIVAGQKVTVSSFTLTAGGA
jgi:hypothetical protein